MPMSDAPFSRLLPAALALGLVWMLPASVLAQAPQALDTPFVPDDYLDTTRRLGGESIRFCSSSASALRTFDREVAEEIGAMLLLEVTWEEIRYPYPAPPYDFQIGLAAEALFADLNNRCDVFTGFVLASLTFPDWLTVTAPYLTTRTVLATREGGPARLEATDAGARIGTRLGSGADAIFSAFLAAAPEGRWRRIPYPDNRALLRALDAGEVDAALVWEPALSLAAAAGEGLGAWVEMSGGPSLPPVSFGMVTLRENLFVRELLDQALAEMSASGILAEITARHGF